MTEDKRPVVTPDSAPQEIDKRLVELAWKRAHLQAFLESDRLSDEQLADYERQLEAVLDEEAPLEAAYNRRRWSRWWWVPNGHLHREGKCSTLYQSTELRLTPAASGLSDEELVDKFGWYVCTTCYPDAPALPSFRTPGTYAAEQADAEGWCLNTVPSYVDRRYRSPYGGCNDCDATGVAVTSLGKLRKHKHQRRADAADREARIKDPKLIGTATGEPLMVDRSEIKTRRTAEIDWVRHMEYAHPDGWGRDDEGRAEERRFARQIAEALAAKDQVTVEEIEAELMPKVEAKIRKAKREFERSQR
ncbi:hypothetical protein [Micromonospora maritima]|uniref:hypothetical protein n=1 Tax=Micromonospora maritima TaxID=986711 RepID=UPI00157CD02E|nr:hypothetical protein [Micromonospora maritima]